MDDSEIIFSQVISPDIHSSSAAVLPFRCSKHLGRFQKYISAIPIPNNDSKRLNSSIRTNNVITEKKDAVIQGINIKPMITLNLHVTPESSSIPCSPKILTNCSNSSQTVRHTEDHIPKIIAVAGEEITKPLSDESKKLSTNEISVTTSGETLSKNSHEDSKKLLSEDSKKSIITKAPGIELKDKALLEDSKKSSVTKAPGIEVKDTTSSEDSKKLLSEDSKKSSVTKVPVIELKNTASSEDSKKLLSEDSKKSSVTELKIKYVMIQSKTGQKKVVAYDENAHNWVKKRIAPNGLPLDYCSWCSGKVNILSSPKYAFWDIDNMCYDTCHAQEIEEEEKNKVEQEKLKTRINNYLLNSEKAIQVHKEFMNSKEQFSIDTKSVTELEKKIEKSRAEINHQDPTYMALSSASQRLAEEMEAVKESAGEAYDNLLSRGLIKENIGSRDLYIKQRSDDREKECSKARADLNRWINRQKMMAESKDVRELELKLSKILRQNESNTLTLRHGAERPFYYIYSSHIELSEIASISPDELEKKKLSINLNRYIFPNISQRITSGDCKSLVNEVYVVISKILDEYSEYIPRREWKSVYEKLRNSSRFEKECKSRLKINKGVIKMECRAAVFGSKTIRSTGEIVETKNLPQQLVTVIPKRTSNSLQTERLNGLEHEELDESSHERTENFDRFHEKELELFHS